MASMNRVYLLGNLTRDPVLRRLNSGTSVADMGLAVSENGDGKGEGKKPAPVFVDLVAWSKLAETCGTYLAKGSQVLVEGRLQLDEWTDDKGNKRSKFKVCAERIQFLGRLREAVDDAGSPEPEPPPERASRGPAPRAADRR
jgi:single-strand DNA-binding protein